MDPASITAETPMGDIMGTFPGARRALFSRYHLGGCQSCGFADTETLAELCARSGPLDVAEVRDHLLASHAHDESMMISPAELKAELDSPAPPLLLDTRTREEHEAVSIPGAVFLDQDLQQKIFSADPQRRIILHDHSGKHVLDTCAWFLGHGMKNTRALKGGIDSWSQDIDPKLPRYRLEID
ncbi:rhodanese-like domain-containing protein [Luteolibacter sp. GHJ8]|uniref:Rhodanese-like domain-containing protein n=1 Tax=Luteolibacter rhizosphaerae TaxID=2989719 RepID=A0ABT3G9W7_9BACT|nr:rhodanese-like domain-containing protein [Luteolibacter rhizosphaerae]MCW1916639.1 rhodanese-like domain-containing protein [Luteolibacter rhizosphaerae]